MLKKTPKINWYENERETRKSWCKVFNQSFIHDWIKIVYKFLNELKWIFERCRFILKSIIEKMREEVKWWTCPCGPGSWVTKSHTWRLYAFFLTSIRALGWAGTKGIPDTVHAATYAKNDEETDQKLNMALTPHPFQKCDTDFLISF